jgi:multicomponent Na+:H+ antiporter subunit C
MTAVATVTGAAVSTATGPSPAPSPLALPLPLAAAAESGATETGPNLALALVLGALFAVGTYLVLRRDVVRVVWGVSIISQSANVYLVTMGGITPAADAPVGNSVAGATDPLVQALVLTAIVIGFGTTALALVLTYRVYEEHGTIDTREIADFDPETGGGADGSGTGTGAQTDGGTGGERA